MPFLQRKESLPKVNDKVIDLKSSPLDKLYLDTAELYDYCPRFVQTPKHGRCNGKKVDGRELQLHLTAMGLFSGCPACNKNINYQSLVEEILPTARICWCNLLCLKRTSKNNETYYSCPLSMRNTSRCRYYSPG
tara:strand:+ start:9089 stop:9490 length:402 start_codon:yes stop_codon:yes gene_type:complete